MKFALINLILTAFASLAFSSYSGELFEQKSNKAKKLFTMDVVTESKDGVETATATFKDIEGNLVVKESAQLKEDALIKVETDQLQTKQKGSIEVRDGKVYFTLVEADGSSSTKDEKLAKTLVIPANFQKFVDKNWKDLAAGKTFGFRWGVWFRQETVGFELFKISSEKVNDEDVLVFKMKPSSFLIAALVNPIIFRFNKNGRLMMMNGRVAPKKSVDGKFKDLDAEVFYTYPVATK